MGNARRNKYRGTVSVDVDVDVNDVLGGLNDEDFLEEAELRDLVLVKKGQPVADAADIARDITEDLMCRRTAKAQDKLRDLIAAFVPGAIVDAVAAIERGETSLAICLLDGYANPPPAATAKELPTRSVPA